MADDKYLIWGDFDKKHIDFPESKEQQVLAGLERFNEARFKRQYTVFRVNHFASRIITLDDKFELPYNSILHVADNFAHVGQYQDTPRMDNPFIERESLRKFIYHVRELDTTGSAVYTDKFILRFSGLPSKLMEFRSEQGANFRYINSLEEIPSRRDALTVINHNPLFRIRMYGRLPFYRATTQILASILNTCEKLTNLNKHQFVMLPWDEEVFDKQLFVRSRNELSFVTVRKPNSFHYILMMHLLNYMWEGATTSIFSKFKQETLNQITIVLNCNDKYVFLNLGDIKLLNDKNRSYYKFVNLLNLLSIMSRADAETNEDIKKYIDTVTEPDNESPIISHVINPSVISNISSVVSSSPENKVSEDDKATEVISKLDTIVKKAPSKEITKVADINTAIPNKSAVISTVTSDKKVETKIAKVIKASNITSVVEKADKDTHSVEYITDLDKETNSFIDASESLTPAAKEHYRKVANKYKTCKIGNETIEDLLTKETNIALTDNTLDEKQLGFIPDKSALKSTATTFDKDYVKKTYKRQLAGTLASFQKNGLFLTNIEETDNFTTFDNYTEYKCKFEDINGNSTTIKFNLPKIDAEGKFVADGKKQIIKKQRIALPIIKINDHEVALSSNYNKVRVYRNPNKAHNFGSFVYAIVTKKSTATVVYGHATINEPISYEYTEIASKFREINFIKDKRRFSLHFGYDTRFKHFNGKQEVFDKLEANYGTYFGKDNTNYFFVDVENNVFTINQRGGENTDGEFNCILDILELSTKDGKIPSFSEWVDITILNGKLPVMFCLGYRYGLRNTLDYLGIKYVIIDNATKMIVGESGMEGFDVDSRASGDRYYDTSWIPNPSREDDYCLDINKVEDATDTELISDTTGDRHIPITEMTVSEVKPRLGKIKIFFSKSVNEKDINPVSLTVKGFLVEVKLGTKHSVTRRITNYDGKIYKCLTDSSIPKDLVEKAADYLNCSESKISRASVTFVGNHANIKEVNEAKRITPAEYGKLVSSINSDINKVSVEALADAKHRKQPHDIRLKFADRTIIFNRYPIDKSLIAAGMDKFDLTPYELSDFEDKDVYYRLLADNGISPNLLKGIEAMFDLFIDNITYQVLKSMHEPTNFRDLLIRCGVLLATKDHVPASSAANYRIRGYEQFVAIVYNEISRNVAVYQKNSKTNKNITFSINPNAVYLRIIQNQSTMPAEAANPLEDVKMSTNITYAGIGGRDGESFVLSDRTFADDDVGIISEGTADSGKVGMNAMLSFDPLVVNTTGLLDPKSPDKVTPANCLTAHSLCMPFSSCDDK